MPSGSAGKSFVRELSIMLRAFAEGSALESIALSAVTVLCVLLLQKPHSSSKARDHAACLERRLVKWKEGCINDLVAEGRTIQKHLKRLKSGPRCEAQLARAFAKLMFKGKIKAALRLIAEESSGGILHVGDVVPSGSPTPQTVLDVLKSKHPSRQQLNPDSIIHSPILPEPVHPVLYDRIDASAIRSAALHTEGAGGPSGVDAYGWRRLCTSFQAASADLCHSLALMARRLCCVFVDPQALRPFLACRLVALDKNPGVRPIGICETARRIIAKAILFVTGDDIKEAAGTVQLCAGQTAGIEAAVHAMKISFESEDTEAALLVDASNAFNSLNRQAALHNIRSICPSIATALINTYRGDTELFVDGSTLISEEGTTQGDPLAMPMYALALLPLTQRVNQVVRQTWYADDATATGRALDLRDWWDSLVAHGPALGYNVNPAKTCLITKQCHHSAVLAAFSGTGVQISPVGKLHLGAALGSPEFITSYVNRKVDQWTKELLVLSKIAISQPHAAYSAFTHGLASKWLYLARTIPNLEGLFQPLEDMIRSRFIPALTGRSAPSDQERDLLALPCRLGGIGLTNPTTLSSSEFPASRKVSSPLYKLILEQNPVYSFEAMEGQMSAKSEIRRDRRDSASSRASELKPNLPPTLQQSMELAQERGASSWLTVLPVEEFGFTLHKGAFRDALALRYGWLPQRLPTNCSCGHNFSVEHAFSCPKGGFPTIRHNEIRDFTAHLLSEVCHCVEIEPHLQPISGEAFAGASANVQDGARLDIAADGFWGSRYERTFFDVRVFNPFAQSNRQTPLSTSYRRHENIKKRAYERRIIEVEHGSFTPLVMASSGGLSHAATAAYKRIANLISLKRDQSYSCTMGWIRCHLSFSLLRSSIMCIRGARSSRGHATRSCGIPTDLVRAESHGPSEA